jgi:hypothetical protein
MSYLKRDILEYLFYHRYAPENFQPGPVSNPNEKRPEPPSGLEGLFGGLPRGGEFLSYKECQRTYKSDPDKQLLIIVADTAAYFRVAYKRVIDIVPMCIEHQYLAPFWTALRSNLDYEMELLGDKAAEKYKRYSREEPDLQENRNRLVRMKATLSEGLQIIGEL